MSALPTGALGLTKLHVVILDWHWKDQKERTITGIPEVGGGGGGGEM